MYKTIEEMVIDKFSREVLDLKKPIAKNKYRLDLASFAPNKKFAPDYTEMYVDKVWLVFNVSIKKIKQKSIGEILNYLIQVKKKTMISKFY